MLLTWLAKGVVSLHDSIVWYCVLARSVCIAEIKQNKSLQFFYISGTWTDQWCRGLVCMIQHPSWTRTPWTNVRERDGSSWLFTCSHSSTTYTGNFYTKAVPSHLNIILSCRMIYSLITVTAAWIRYRIASIVTVALGIDSHFLWPNWSDLVKV